jgi:hypothetical protein
MIYWDIYDVLLCIYLDYGLQVWRSCSVPLCTAELEVPMWWHSSILVCTVSIRIVLRIMLIRSWTCRFNNSANDGMFLRFCFSRLPQLTQMTVLAYDCQPRTFCSSCLFSSFCLGDQVIQVIPDSSPPPGVSENSVPLNPMVNDHYPY